jgi:MFS family permease
MSELIGFDAAKAQRVQPRAYAIVVTGVLIVMIAYSIRYGYGMLLPEMLPDLGISKMEAGTIFTSYFIIYTLFSAVMGTLSDLYSYRLILTVFTALLGASAIMMGYVDTFTQACLAFSMAGLGHAACWAPVAGLVQKWVPDNRRGLSLSFVSLGIGIGLILWGYLLPVIVAHADWKAGWKAMGFTALAIALLNLLLVRDPASHGDGPSGDARLRFSAFWLSFQALFNRRVFWIIGMAYMLLGFNVLIPFTFLPVYATEALNIPYAQSTRFIMVLAFTGLIGQLTLGGLSDRIGRIKMMVFCTTLMSLAFLGMVFSHTAYLLYTMAGLFGIGYGAVWLLYAAAAQDFFARSTIGSVLGLWTVFLGIGSIVSPVICGWTIDITGRYTWVFILGFVIGLLSNVALLLVPGAAKR